MEKKIFFFKINSQRSRLHIHTVRQSAGRTAPQGRCPVLRVHTMPREEVHYGYPRKGHSHSYVTAEEAAGIGILVVALGIALLIGCWYCRRRSGYRTLTDKRRHAGTQNTSRERCLCESLDHQDSRLSSQEKNHQPVVPNAPPAYEKLSSDHSPPPYSP